MLYLWQRARNIPGSRAKQKVESSRNIIRFLISKEQKSSNVLCPSRQHLRGGSLQGSLGGGFRVWGKVTSGAEGEVISRASSWATVISTGTWDWGILSSWIRPQVAEDLAFMALSVIVMRLSHLCDLRATLGLGA